MPVVAGIRRGVREALLEMAHLARARRTTRFVTFLYHRVTPAPRGDDPYAVPVAAFRDQLGALADAGFRDVGLDELEAAPPGRPGRRALIAFDDGYWCAVEFALPVLQETGWRAAFFLVPGAMGATSDWELPFGLRPSRIMGWEDVRRLVAAGMSIGSHSLTHADLSAAHERTIEAEVIGSRQRLEEAIGRSVRSFSVPFGRDDGRIDPYLSRAGYVCKLTNPFAASRRSPVRSYPVTGVDRDLTMREFRRHMSGAYDIVLAFQRLRRSLTSAPRT